MKKYLKSEKGITRLTLLLLIIALLMLAGALSFVLYNKTQENSQVASTNETNQNESRVANDSKNETSKSSKKSTSKGNWTQDKTEVTNGDVTLEVGSEIKGYEANEIDEWYLLGAENGKLLITTNKGDEKIELNGKDGYENGVEILNEAVQDYDDGNLAESVRSINVEDVNRITEFEPESYEGYGEECTLEDGEEKVINTFYTYEISETIDEDSMIYNLLNENDDYWLGTQFIYYNEGLAGLGLRYVNEGSVLCRYVADTYGNDYKYSKGLRPVVTLKPEIKINSDGEISSSSDNEKSKNSETENTTNTSKNETRVSSKKSTSDGEWTQDKTEVSSGDVTLEVGSEIKGYEANEIDEWYVLGAEDGKLLITTNKGHERVELIGKDGYENGVEILNNAVQDYNDGDLAESVRSINVDDINRVTGFNPEDDEDYGKEYTYEDEGSFYDGEKWVTLKSGEKINIVDKYYSYYLDKKIAKDSKAYELLKNGTCESCWLGTQYVDCFDSCAYFGMFRLSFGEVEDSFLGDSIDKNSWSESIVGHIVPAVTLKSDVQINSDGEISK